MKVPKKRALIFVLFFLVSAEFAAALEFSLSATPLVTIPFGTPGSELYTIGGGAAINGDLCFLEHFSIGPEIDYYINPLQSGTPVNFMLGGLSASAWVYPASRVVLRAQGTIGLYNLAFTGEVPADTSGSGTGTVETDMVEADLVKNGLWKKAYFEAAFRFTPSFTLGAGIGYNNCHSKDEGLMYTGIIAGLCARVTVDTASSTGNVTFKFDQYEPVFPVFAGMYKQNSIGTLKITNRESAEIRNVNVSFRAGNYTVSLLSCGTIPLLEKRKAKELPLFADFSSTILNFTENGKIPGELVISYDILGVRQETAKTLVLDVYNRNTARWTDSAVLAAFISPNAPEVLDYSKYMVGIARDGLRTGLNRNMQFAAYLYEGLKTGGVTYSHDDTTPYATSHLDPDRLDFIQYPFQTLAYHSGDYDDLGILYAATLESVGIKAAIIPLEKDFVVAFSLGIGPAEAQDLFSSTENLLTIGDEVWIPVTLSVLREGFMNGWYSAMGSLNAAMASGGDLDFIILSEAWQTYPPAAFKNSEAKFDKPDEDTVRHEVETDMLRYISQEFGPKIRAVQYEIRNSGGNAKLYNDLGTLYVRAGMYPEAKKEYERSAALKSVPALVNLGNIALLERDFRTAASWFQKALALQPDSKGAKNGLDRAMADIED